jgi:hypothetical protein
VQSPGQRIEVGRQSECYKQDISAWRYAEEGWNIVQQVSGTRKTRIMINREACKMTIDAEKKVVAVFLS